VVPENIPLTTNEAFELFPTLDKYDFFKHRDNDPVFNFERIHSACPQLRAKLKKLSSSFIFVLHSNSYRKQIEKTLAAINLHDVFQHIIGIEENQRKIANEAIIYSELCHRYNIGVNNILAIGDKMDKDINPILIAGGSALKIESNDYILDALNFITEKFIKQEVSLSI
jgi:FMN phosphatase YigB (HAD superfamily)